MFWRSPRRLALSARPRPPPPKATLAAKKPVPPLKASSTVRRWMKGMTLRDEVAQLIFISFHGAAPNSRSREYRKFMGQIRETKVGGLILVNWSNGRRDPEGGALRGGSVSQPHAAPGQDSPDGERRFRAGRFHARRRHHGVPARHGVRRHGQSGVLALRRRDHGARGPGARAFSGSTIRWPTSTTTRTTRSSTSGRSAKIRRPWRRR